MTTLDVIAFAGSTILTGTVMVLLYLLRGWSGKTARDRNYTRAATVNVCGGLGSITGVYRVTAMFLEFRQYTVRDVLAAVSPPAFSERQLTKDVVSFHMAFAGGWSVVTKPLETRSTHCGEGAAAG